MDTSLSARASRFIVSKSSVAMALIAVASLSVTAHASSIVSDSGFEAASGGNVYYSGSSIDGGSWNVTLGDIYIDTQDPYVYDGNNSANLTAANPYVANSLAETLNTTAGQLYVISFFADSDSPNTILVTDNGSSIKGAPATIVQNGFPGNTNSSLFVDYTGYFVASSASTVLQFSATADPGIGSSAGSVMIDDVSVQAAPEPGSLTLMMTGVLSLGALVERKRLAASFA